MWITPFAADRGGFSGSLYTLCRKKESAFAKKTFPFQHSAKRGLCCAVCGRHTADAPEKSRLFPKEQNDNC